MTLNLPSIMMFQVIGLRDHFDFLFNLKKNFLILHKRQLKIVDSKFSLFLTLLRLLLISFKFLIWIKIKNLLKDIGMNIKS